MYRVSPFVRHFAISLAIGILVATFWVNLAPTSYYDFIEWRLFDVRPLMAGLDWFAPRTASITLASFTSEGLMALFMFFVGKELWEAFALDRGALSGPQALIPLGGVVGAALGACAIWAIAGQIWETADEAGFATGWQVPIGSDVVLGYFVGRKVFGAGHPALHVLLLVTIASDILGLFVLGVSYPAGGFLQLAWLALPLLAGFGIWALYGRRPNPNTLAKIPERLRRRGLMLWPYILAGVVSYVGVARAGLPAALGLLPIIPAIPHADRAFGFFAEAESFLHDPLNRLAHALVRPLAVVLCLFGLTRGGIDIAAFAPTTMTVLAALWIGKPLGFLIGSLLVAWLTRTNLPPGITLRDMILISVLLGIGFVVPVLALDTALPGGGMAEAARLGLALSIAAGPAALALSRLLQRPPITNR